MKYFSEAENITKGVKRDDTGSLRMTFEPTYQTVLEPVRSLLLEKLFKAFVKSTT